MSEQGPDLARLFHSPPGRSGPFDATGVLLIVFGVLLVSLIVALVLGENTPWAMVLFSVGLLLEFSYALRRYVVGKPTTATFEVTKNGLSKITEPGPKVLARWDDVRRIVFVPSAPPRLTLFRSGEPIPWMSVPLSLVDIEELLRLLVLYGSNLEIPAPVTARMPARRLWRTGFWGLLIFFPFFIVAGYWLALGDWEKSTFALLLPAVVWVPLFSLFALFCIREISVSHGDLVVRSTIREQRWDLAKIRSVRLAVDRSAGFLSLVFDVTLSSGKVKRVPCVTDEPIAFCQALNRDVVCRFADGRDEGL
jgi:hypothetical protein